MAKKNTLKKKSIAFFILSLVIFALAFYILIGSMVAKKENKPFQFFGVSLHIVQTNSMEPEIRVGDYLIAQSRDISKVKIGDDVVFVSPDPSLKGITIVHRVINIEIIDGKTSLTTKGINNTIEDKYKVNEIIGVKILNSASLGKIYYMFTTPMGLIIAIIVVVSIFVVVSQTKKIIMTLKEKNSAGAQVADNSSVETLDADINNSNHPQDNAGDDDKT